MVVCIKLTKGYHTIVDNADYELIKDRSWHVAIKPRSCYARCRERIDGKAQEVSMARLLMQPSEGLVVDHINGNGLDNRRENLRVCTYAQNAMNRGKRTSTSKYKAVHKRPDSGKWQATIMLNGKQESLGCYVLEKDAAKAYNKAALKHYGEFARLNIIEE